MTNNENKWAYTLSKEKLLTYLTRGAEAIQEINKISDEVDFLEKGKPKSSAPWKVARVVEIIVFALVVLYLLGGAFLNISVLQYWLTENVMAILIQAIILIVLFNLIEVSNFYIDDSKARTQVWTDEIEKKRREITRLHEKYSKELAIMPVGYHMDLDAYQKALGYLKEGKASNLEGIIDLLDQDVT